MYIAPELSNPDTVLHVLKYKASLPVLIAMCMPDCPRPVTINWLEIRTGVSADTAEKSLKYLSRLYLVFREGIKRASRWWLANGVRQLHLPFVANLRQEDTKPHPLVIESGRDTLPDHRPLDIENGQDVLPDHRPLCIESDRELLPDHRPLDDHAVQLIIPKISGLSDEDEPIIHKFSGLSAAPPMRVRTRGDHVVDHLIQDHDLKSNDQQHGPIIPKISGLLLRWMGLDEPVPTQFQDVDPAWPLGDYWYAVVAKFDRPAGYVRRRLEQNLTAPRPYPQMAATWVALDSQQRRILLDAGADARWSGRVSLPSDFGHFVPYREFRLLYVALNGRIAPDFLMPPDVLFEDDLEVDDAVKRDAAECGAAVAAEPVDVDSQQLWRDTLAEMAQQMSCTAFDTWLRDARLVAINGGVYVVGVRNDYARDWLEHRLGANIQRTMVAICGHDLSLDFVVKDEA